MKQQLRQVLTLCLFQCSYLLKTPQSDRTAMLLLLFNSRNEVTGKVVMTLL